MEFSIQKMESSIGVLYLVATETHLYGMIFEKMWHRFKNQFANSVERENEVLIKTKSQLTEYFEGKLKQFELPVEFMGTSFQKQVWAALQLIPFGETKSYKEQAQSMQSPKASRAVGRANGLNPISIILPCHRVIGSNGALTGYGGGVETKKYLLNLEGSI